MPDRRRTTARETQEQYVLIGAVGTSILGPIVDQMR